MTTNEASAKTATASESGTEVFIPLNKLKKSPRNARKTLHSEAIIEGYAASIAAKGILQNLVVEPELDGEGAETGFYFRGKGQQERCLPLWKDTARDLRARLSVRGAVSVPELFVNARGEPMTRAGFEYILDKHVRKAAETCTSLRGRSVSPNQLRHSCAVIMLQATHDIRKVAQWPGHADIRTTEVYLRMDLSEKLEAVEAIVPPELRRGRFKAPDALIASLLSDAEVPPG